MQGRWICSPPTSNSEYCFDDLINIVLASGEDASSLNGATAPEESWSSDAGIWPLKLRSDRVINVWE